MTGSSSNLQVRIKVCGLTSAADARVAEAAGVDAVGLIFAERSRRKLTFEQAAEIAAALGPFVVRVGVFVDAALEEVEAAIARVGLQAVQLHGAEDAAYAARLMTRVRVIKAVPVGPDFAPQAWRRFPAHALLLDGPAPGSGTAFDWRCARELGAELPLIVAGGLTPHNVAAAIRSLQPYGVDVASGVESRPGVKDPAKIQGFVRAVRAA